MLEVRTFFYYGTTHLETYLKFLIRIKGPFSCLYSFYTLLYSAEERAEQNETCYQNKHFILFNVKHLIKSQIFRNILLLSKSLSVEANVNIPTGSGVLWH